MKDDQHCSEHSDCFSEQKMQARKITSLCNEGKQMRMEIDRLKESVIHITYIKQSVDRIENALDEKFVTRAAFDPVRNAVYGISMIAAAAVFGTIWGIVIK